MSSGEQQNLQLPAGLIILEGAFMMERTFSFPPTRTAAISLLEPSAEAPLKIAVIGGGITGLSAAHRLIELCAGQGRRLELTLFESSHRVGGVFGSEQIGDYLIERGADSFITNKPAGISLCRRLGLEDQLVSTNPRYRRSLILCRGRTVPTPEGFNLLAPARLWPMLTTPLLSWRGKLRLLAEPWVPRQTRKEEESLAAFVRRRLGSEMLDRIVQPMVGGIYTSDPEQLSLAATLPRFLQMEQEYGSLRRGMRRQSHGAREQVDSAAASGARYGLFASLKNGMQQLLDTLEQRIAAQTLHRTGPRVTRLTRRNSSWHLETGNSVAKSYDGVIVALPAPAAAQLLDETEPRCANALRAIQAASSAIVITGHDLSQVKHPVDAFGLVIPHCENRRILAASFLSRKFTGRAPEGKILIRTFVGGALQPEMLEHPDGRLIDIVLEELRSILGVRGTPEVAVVARYPQGMPQYQLGHQQRVDEIRACAATLPSVQIAGNYLHGVGLPDCIQSGENAAENLLQSFIQTSSSPR